MRTTDRSRQKIMLLTAGLVLLFVLLCLSGCRYRITGTAEADTVIDDYDGTMQTQYEQQREEIDMEPEPPQTPPQQEQTKLPQTQTSNTASVNTANTSNGGNSSGSSKNGNGNGSGKNGNGKSKKSETNNKTQKAITVKLDPCGGSCESESLKVYYGKLYGNLPAAVRDGYVFRGWFTAADQGSQVTAATKVTNKKNHTIYAHWEKVTSDTAYTITFDANGGRINKKYATRTLREGDIYGTFPSVYNDGYQMDGWFTQPEGGTQIHETTTYPGGGDQILYAHWSYDPYTYWSYRLKNTTEQMYSCQEVACYIEFEDHVTASSCPLLSDCKAQNIAMNRDDDVIVTDDWVNGKNPKVVIKCAGGNTSSAYDTMAQRFPSRRVLVVPDAAVYGNANEQLYYKLNLGVLVYPDWYADIDLEQAAKDLGVNDRIYE